jgi:hypothetical protein
MSRRRKQSANSNPKTLDFYFTTPQTLSYKVSSIAALRSSI